MKPATRGVLVVGVALVVLGVPWLLKGGGKTGGEAKAGPLAVAAGAASRAGDCVPGAAGPGGKCAPAAAASAPVPRFVDLGTTTCAPCRVMLGIMQELEQRYPHTLKVEFINVQLDREALDRYGIQVIPAQIFFSPDGKELFRHKGVFRTDAVAAKWKELGYDLGEPVGGELPIGAADSAE